MHSLLPPGPLRRMQTGLVGSSAAYIGFARSQRCAGALVVHRVISIRVSSSTFPNFGIACLRTMKLFEGSGVPSPALVRRRRNSRAVGLIGICAVYLVVNAREREESVCKE